MRPGFDAGVKVWVGAGDASTQLDEVFRLAVSGERFTYLSHMFHLAARGELRLQAADGIEHLNRGIVAGRPKLAREDDMSVEDGAERVADRLIKIVSLDQDGKKSGNGAVAKVARTFADLGEKGEDRRSVTLLAGRLSGGEADFALSHGEASG